MAGKAHDLKQKSSKDDYLQTNFELTKEVYDSFLKSSATKFIFSSTIKAVADEEDGIITEDYIPDPKTPYGESKLKAEQYILAQPLPDGKNVYILRPCMIHGKGNKGNFNLLYTMIKKGIPYPLGAFENKRSFLYIENLCFIIHELIIGEVNSGVYNVCDDLPLSTNRVIEIIAAELSKRPRVWKINKLLIKIVAAIGDIFHLPLNSDRLQKLTKNYVLSNKKILSAIGKALPVTAEEGIHKTVQSFIHAT